MNEPNRVLGVLGFAIYMTPDGPVIDNKLEPALCLRILGSACEDLRLRMAVEQMRKDLIAAAQKAQEEKRIQVIPANGAPRVVP